MSDWDSDEDEQTWDSWDDINRGFRKALAGRSAEGQDYDRDVLKKIGGFLGGLLERLGFLGLEALEMRVWTDERGVDDRFYVKQRDGGVPSRRTAKLLREALEGRLLR